MGSREMSTGLALNLDLGILTPASAVRAGGGHTANQDAQAKARRRPRPSEGNEESAENLPDGSSSGGSDLPAHQLDHLA